MKEKLVMFENDSNNLTFIVWNIWRFSCHALWKLNMFQSLFDYNVSKLYSTKKLKWYCVKDGCHSCYLRTMIRRYNQVLFCKEHEFCMVKDLCSVQCFIAIVLDVNFFSETEHGL